MKSLRCLIVDDERLARVALRALLADIPGVMVVGEAGRPDRAVAAVLKHRPDLILLDVQMPRGGGFAVLRALKTPPAVIFVTAYDQYALRAFEVNAVDYLLKPVEPKRLKQAVSRAAAKHQPPRNHRLKTNDSVLLELGSSGHFRSVRDILAVKADGKYSKVLCSGGRSYLVRRTMSEWEGRLPPSMFVRLDRGVLANVTEIRSADFLARGATFKLGESPELFEVGRNGASKLRDVLKRQADAES